VAAHATDAFGSSGALPPVPVVCPLLELASAPAGGASAVDSSNRCASFSQPRVIAVTQQRLVCLGDAHVDCPLFARLGRRGRGSGGRSAQAMPVPVAVPVPAAVVGRPAAVTVRPAGSDAAGLAMPADHVDDVPSSESESESGSVSVPIARVTRASRGRQARPASRPMPTIVAAIILVVALGAAFTFTTFRGGLSMPGGGSGSPGVAAASSTPGAPTAPTAPGAATANPTVQPVPVSPTPSAAALAAATPTMTPAPSAIRSPTPRPTVRPSAAPTTGPAQTPSASLPPAFAGLDACPDRAGCYLYRIRSGDNLTLVALHFGVTLVALRAANPEIVDPSLIHVGDLIRIPVPAPTP
jgi:hypothetical protein